MTKGRIIGAVFVALIVLGGAFGISEFLSYRDVSVVLKQSDAEVEIYNSDNRKITNVATDELIRLKVGEYYYKPVNEKFSTANVNFSIQDNTTVEIDPSFSPSYLANLLAAQQNDIRAALSSSYPSALASYVIGDEALAHKGEWYSAKLIQRVSGGNQPDVYRVILEKKNESWTIVASPQLVISKAADTAIPADVIRKVNEPLSNEAYALLYPE